MWACNDGGVDMMCTWQGQRCTLRMRYCLDAQRRVRLFGTGVIGGNLVRAEVLSDTVHVVPKSHTQLIRKCVANARDMLGAELRAYISKFPDDIRPLIDVSRLVRRRRPSSTLSKPGGGAPKKKTRR